VSTMNPVLASRSVAIATDLDAETRPCGSYVG